MENENIIHTNPNGSFTINREKQASYSLPTFKAVEGEGLKPLEKELTIEFVKSIKTKTTMVILELTDIGNGPIWKYEAPNGKVEHYPLEHEGLKKINAKWIENKEYQLEIYDGEENAGIKVPHTGVLTLEDQVIGADEELVPDAYVAAVDVEQETLPQEGITTQCLLNMMIYDLKLKHQELPSRETTLAITKLEEAQLWLAKRVIDRQARGVLSTNKK